MLQQFTLFLQQTFEVGLIINLPYLFLSIYLGEGRIYYLQQVRRTVGTFPQSRISLNCKTGEVLS